MERNHRKYLCRVVSLMLALVLAISPAAQAAAPKMNAAITQGNALALARETDADGAYILQSAVDAGEGILEWWSGQKSVAVGMDTAVHEEFHAYSMRKSPWNSEDIYLGNKTYDRVSYTDVYRSRIMGATIPANLRTMRWELYVGNPTANMASDANGVYGLLNEFAAYYWGMHAQMSLFGYYKQQKATPDQWKDFVVLAANDRLAYAEFKYYILKYLAYAKQHYPGIYKGIVENAKFVHAYQTIEGKFAALVKKFEKSLKDIAALLEKQGYDVKIDEYFYVDSQGVSIFQADYARLVKELEKATYRNLLTKGGTSGQKLKKPKLASVSNTGKRKLSVKWNAVSGATGYQISYSTKKNFANEKKVTVKASAKSKKIAGLSKNKRYYVRVRACRKSAGKTAYSAWSDAKSVKIVK